MTELLSPGRYRHYKNNNEYTVISIVRHSETEEALVLYRAEVSVAAPLVKDVFSKA